MALSRADPAAASLANAMLSVAAFHYGNTHTAVLHKTDSLRSLSRSLRNSHQRCTFDESKTQLAASLMLCVYSVGSPRSLENMRMVGL